MSNISDLNEFTIKDITYRKSRWGHLVQVDPKPFVYDKEYNDTYDTEAYKKDSLRLCEIRYRLIDMIGYNPKRVLDFGYGNGAFLDYVSDKVDICHGYDIASGHESNKWTKVDKFIYDYDVVCFWDSLEHVKDIGLLDRLNTKYVAISLPYAHLNKWSIEEFEDWKHRKPNEHIHHFNQTSLVAMFNFYGYEMICFNNNEDEVRKPIRNEKNILSALFVKKQ